MFKTSDHVLQELRRINQDLESRLKNIKNIKNKKNINKDKKLFIFKEKTKQ